MHAQPLMALTHAAEPQARVVSGHVLAVLTLVVAGYSATLAASPWTGRAIPSLSSTRETSAATARSQVSNVALYPPPPAGVTYLNPPPSEEVTELRQWVITSRDNDSMPFLIIDKTNAAVFVFDAAGHLQAAAPALLGLTRGDREAKGVSHERVLALRAQERITPAGRFVASLGYEPDGRGLLWVDYKDAIALHPVVKGTPQEHRAERLESLTSADNRISYGCINVPLKFYASFVRPAFIHTSGIVYILPETRLGRRSFWSDKVEHGATFPFRPQP
jgi:hypothetical protein